MNISFPNNARALLGNKRIYSSEKNSLMDGLVSWWTLDDGTGTTAKDAVGDNDGILTGGATWTVGPGSESNKAVVFDGSNDGIDVVHNANLNFGVGAFTISAWFYTTLLGLDSIVRKDNGTAEYGLRIISSKLTLYTANPIATYRSSAVNITTNVWMHCVGCREDDGSINVYLNGVLSNGTLSDTGIKNTDNTSDLSIGYNKNTGGGYFGPGYISDVRIYNRALSATEIARLANTY